MAIDPQGFEPEQLQAAAALRRAMPLQRLIGNGMSYADATALHRASEALEDWTLTAERLGEANLARGVQARQQQHRISARAWFLFASAAWRFGQIPLDDADVRKGELYRCLIRSFDDALHLQTPAGEHVDLRDGDTVVCGWLERPEGVERPPTVVIFGGFDGWREEYHNGAQALLARGVATLLVDGPGQGESRILHGSYFHRHSAQAIAACVDYLRGRNDLGDAVGVWGNSFGGHLAAQVAMHDPRIAACCVNGGTIRPAEILDRFPRFVSKMMAMTGLESPDAARAIFESLTLSKDDLASLRCPLLLLHGVPDQVFLYENARALHDWSPANDKTMLTWEDGDHCIYNHSDEKHCSVADWFSDRLGPTAIPPQAWGD